MWELRQKSEVTVLMLQGQLVFELQSRSLQCSSQGKKSAIRIKVFPYEYNFKVYSVDHFRSLWKYIGFQDST